MSVAAIVLPFFIKFSLKNIFVAAANFCLSFLTPFSRGPKINKPRNISVHKGAFENKMRSQNALSALSNKLLMLIIFPFIFSWKGIIDGAVYRCLASCAKGGFVRFHQLFSSSYQHMYPHKIFIWRNHIGEKADLHKSSEKREKGGIAKYINTTELYHKLWGRGSSGNYFFCRSLYIFLEIYVELLFSKDWPYNPE